MTMFKTKEQIEEMAKEFSERSAEHGYHRTESYRGFKIGYTQAQEALLESASEDHKFHWNSLTPHDQITLTSYGASEKAWQACALSYEKKIQELKRENESLKVNLNTCKNDYWFMTNLLEKYSTDKEQAIKDCIERMKFRKLLFKQESKE